MPAKKSAAAAKHAKPAAKSVTKAPAGKPLEDRLVELLFEIGAEEIPAGMLPRAISELKTIFEKHLTAENLHGRRHRGNLRRSSPPHRRGPRHPRQAGRCRVRNYRPAAVRGLRQCRRADTRRRQLRRKAGRLPRQALHRHHPQGRIHRRSRRSPRPHRSRSLPRDSSPRPPRHSLAAHHDLDRPRRRALHSPHPLDRRGPRRQAPRPSPTAASPPATRLPGIASWAPRKSASRISPTTRRSSAPTASSSARRTASKKSLAS